MMALVEDAGYSLGDDKHLRVQGWSPASTMSPWSQIADIRSSRCTSPSSRERPKAVNEATIAKLGIRGFLESAAEQAESFTSLSLAENNIGDEGARVVREVLSTRAHCIRRISLLRTGLGPDGLLQIGQLAPTCAVLETLILSGNDFCGGSSEEDPFAMFCECIVQARELRVLHLTHAGLTSELLRPLCAALRSEAMHIEHLDLSHNELDSRIMTELGQSLKANFSLHTLKLTANKLGFKGGEALAAGLSKAPECALRRLGLDRNALELRGCSALARLWAEKAGPQLDLLDLRENRLTDSGCQDLCRIFAHPPGWTLEFGSRKVLISWPSKHGTVVHRTWQGHRPANVFWYD